MARYADSAAFDAAMEKLCAYWEKLLNQYRVVTGDKRLDRMVNIWNQYQ